LFSVRVSLYYNSPFIGITISEAHENCQAIKYSIPVLFILTLILIFLNKQVFFENHAESIAEHRYNIGTKLRAILSKCSVAVSC
jgi:hypothetical protein